MARRQWSIGSIDFERSSWSSYWWPPHAAFLSFCRSRLYLRGHLQRRVSFSLILNELFVARCLAQALPLRYFFDRLRLLFIHRTTRKISKIRREKTKTTTREKSSRRINIGGKYRQTIQRHHPTWKTKRQIGRLLATNLPLSVSRRWRYMSSDFGRNHSFWKKEGRHVLMSVHRCARIGRCTSTGHTLSIGRSAQRLPLRLLWRSQWLDPV